ncbi:uncharacterized protein GLRG_11767 [Colletotrichum graminicola M1.001]|uniref:Reverse transcriptase RNase H-like domain-containing protein n=1 Tax=Colletotrichum graminicola (strain M1.001 / M2 / FGSC 10212) TaxID=645133 RepID=E3R0I4_COLGM|nr:uncharacterized protein GLRG_11767 [Colletotrichum graminicola M1.001]EFQ36622.1 hypothetical protein GLRG_11767 [Colletotrichum graminicola M1.001]
MESPIAFLSRTLSDAEKRYWSTELEVTGCVWTITKCCYWIQSTQVEPVIVFTDHKAIVDIQSRQAPTPFDLLQLDPRVTPFHLPRDAAHIGSKNHDAVLKAFVKAD